MQTMMQAGSLDDRKRNFLRQASAVHHRRYSYELAAYVNNKTPVVIVCRMHERPFAFSQTPHDHVKGRGCPNCGRRTGSSSSTRARVFTAKAIGVHGGRYDYASADYVDAHTPILILCPQHGPFKQRPTKHLQGSGCSTCARPCSPAMLRRKARRGR